MALATFAISPGVVTTLVQNEVYACPAAACVVVSDLVLEFANVTTTTAFAAVASSTTGFTSAWAFVRCTTGAAIVSFRK